VYNTNIQTRGQEKISGHFSVNKNIGIAGGIMIKHVVMWKLKDYAEEAGRARNAKRLKIELEALKSSIPQIQRIEVGINCIESPAAYDVILSAVFRNQEDLDIYQRHPNHRAVADFIAKINEHRAVVDYKTD
jgi:Stress responsive A/B Barrel Domain